MADNSTKYKVKSIYFTENNFEYLDFVMEQIKISNESFSDFIISMIKEKKEQGIKIPDNMKKYINEFLEERVNELVREIVPLSIQDNRDILKEIKDEIDPEVIAAMNQFDNF